LFTTDDAVWVLTGWAEKPETWGVSKRYFTYSEEWGLQMSLHNYNYRPTTFRPFLTSWKVAMELPGSKVVLHSGNSYRIEETGMYENPYALMQNSAVIYSSNWDFGIDTKAHPLTILGVYGGGTKASVMILTGQEDDADTWRQVLVTVQDAGINMSDGEFHQLGQTQVKYWSELTEPGSMCPIVEAEEFLHTMGGADWCHAEWHGFGGKNFYLSVNWDGNTPHIYAREVKIYKFNSLYLK